MAESAVGSVVVLPTDCLLTAFREVLKDDGFNVPSQAAVDAVKCAEQLIEWSCEQENKDMVARFASDLVTEMLECFDGPPAAPRTMRERMWGKFFDMRSSIQYKSRWMDFISKSTGGKCCPTFYQYVTNSIMESLIKYKFPLMEETPQQSESLSLSYEEKNAMRYTAGYVIRAVKKKIKKSACSEAVKAGLGMCLTELLGEECHDDSNDWVSMIDRGGLNHVNDMTFCAMELDLLAVLAINTRNDEMDLMKSVKQKITVNEDFLFAWSIISINWEEEEPHLLKDFIVDHWITVRGFSYANAFLEKYKQASKKAVQKSKGLREQLVE